MAALGAQAGCSPADGSAAGPGRLSSFDGGPRPRTSTAADAGLALERPYPAPGAHPANRGPGGPQASFSLDDLYRPCAYLDGGPQDTSDHHNLVVMFDGYLLMPWAPEQGRGGLTAFDVSDPCRPLSVGTGLSAELRETHALGFAELEGRWLTATARIAGPSEGGALIWDVTDPRAPVVLSAVSTPGFAYPDAYARVTLGTFLQAPYLYVAGADSGLFIIDLAEPTSPRLVAQLELAPVLRVGLVQAVGNLLLLGAAEGPRVVLLDISDPVAPEPIPGGDFLVRDEHGTPREVYSGTWFGGYGYFANKDGGGGLITYDLRDPEHPTFRGIIHSAGNGGYVSGKDRRVFVGESSSAAIYDVGDPARPTEIARLRLAGDLDTITPIGNVAVLSVDADAEQDRGSAIAPVSTEVDVTPPSITFWWPRDGSTGLPLTSRLGVSFSEAVDPKTAWEGSVRLYESGSEPARTRVDGVISVQETIVSFAPRAPLRPGTAYTLELPRGGVADVRGNRLATTFLLSFETVGARR